MSIFVDAESDRNWREVGEQESWELPEKAPWILRLPIVRGVRYIYHTIRFHRHQEQWGHAGLFSTGYDEWVLYAIARGWC